jgi:hypothetical protein
LFLLAVTSSRGKYNMFTRTVRQLALFITIVATVLFLGSTGSPQTEIREYEGKRPHHLGGPSLGFLIAGCETVRENGEAA